MNVGVGGHHILLQMLLCFIKAGSFAFGTGLAIVPFLQQRVVQQFGWLNEHVLSRARTCASPRLTRP